MRRSAIRWTAFLSLASLAAGAALLAYGLPNAVAAEGEPTLIVNGEFTPPDGLTAFKAMTFVVDMAPGLEVPLHSHPGRGQVMVVDGEVTVKDLNGPEVVYKKGDVWIEEVDNVHTGRNSGAGTARLVWTILVPEGAELEIPYKQ